MADSEWRLEEDGQLKLDVKCNSLIYHPNLNIIIVLTKSSEVLVVDVNSGLLLQRSHLSASDSAIQGQYLPGYDKILLANEKGIGVRSDYNGVLLLDTILQTPISKPDEIVKLEIPLSEAQILKQTLQCMDLQGVERVSEVVEELTNKTKEADAKSKKGLKAQKWNTVCLSVGHCALKWVCAGMVSELRRQNRHIPALSTASALSERLNWLLLPPAAPSGAASAAAASDTPPPDRTLMFSEAIRRQTFANWPHMNYKWALPDQMAQAGFYHQPNSAGDDRAMCFTCIVCLVCWEPTDEPWSEHERHSPSCPFVKGEYTQNVPLSVTYATAPAVATPHPVTILGTSSVPELFATATVTGLIQVWNCSRQLKNEISFYSFGSDARTYPREGWAEQEIVEIPLSDFTLDNLIKNSSSQDIKLGAVSIVGMLKHPSPSASASGGVGHQDATDDEDDATSRYRRPALITGISVMSRSKRPPQSSGSVVVPPSVRAMNDVNQATGGATSSATSDHLDIMKVMDGGSSSGNYDRQLLLVVYDFHYQSSSGRALPKEGSWSGGGGGGGGGGGPGGGGLGGSGTNGINNVTVDGNVGGVGGGGGGSYSSAVANQSKGGGGASKKVGSGTGTSASRLENNIQEIFLSKLFYCQNSLMDDVELAPEPEVHYSSMPSFQATEAFPSQPPPIAVVVPPVGGGTFNASMGMDMMQFPSTSSNMAPPSVIKVSVSNRELKAAGSGGGVGGGRSYNGGGSVCVSASAREPASVQCVTVDTSGRNSAITGIYPTRDGRHVLVTLGSTSDEERTSSGGVFVIYALVFDRPVVSVRENPLCWREFESEPKQVLLLPLGSDSTSLAASPLGVAVIVTDDGALHVIDVATLETLSTMSPPDGTKFVTATYCFSLERLCASTADGDLHFFSMKDGDDRKQDEASSLSMDQSSSLQKPNGEQMLVTSPVLSIRELRLLFELTQFENLSPCYAATVPACWTELMQAQKQRRHPQHLQHADELHHTRSWRLQHDNSTWDEHVFEITLPMSVCIGHVDVKFTLHSHCATPPQIEVTLLKQNATAIGKTQDNFNRNTIVDSGIDFNLNTDGAAGKKGSQENPVTNEDYLQTHNMEVLCGPINLASCLDLTEQGGTVTFSSVKLFRVRSRTLLVHMKSLADPASGQASGKKAKVDPNFSWDMANMANSTPDSIVERLTNASRKVEYVGCDWIHEVSITIRKAKQTEIPNDRLERYAMLESNKFVEKLLDAIFSNEGNGDRGRVEQNIALDILNWIAVIRLGRLRCCQPSWLRLQIEFIKMIQSYQHILIQTCFVQGGRSIAQKCVKLFTICSDGVKNLEDNSLKDFNRSLVEVFLESLNYSILQSWSAGAMRWFFHCLARMIASDPNSALKASYRSLMLLSKVARHLKMRQNPSYLLLRSRFGLYGTPFEAELFDIDPPVPAKFSSMPVTYASLVAQELAWAGGVGSIPSSALGGLSSEPIDLRELLPIFGNGNNQTESGKPNLYHNLAKLKGLTSNLYMKGLLEVEPLHFTCHSTSDGTKLEKMESAGINNPWGNLYEAQPFHLATSESKSTNDYEQQALVEDLKEEIGKMKMKKLKDVLASIKVAKSLYKQEMMDGVRKSPSSSAASTVATFGNTDGSGSGNTASGSSSAMAVCHSMPQSVLAKDGVFSWQQLLMAPAQQMLVIERMHSGARRFVVLDLGAPVLLTDLIVPACPELLSLSVDIWTRSEEADAQRLVVASDIASKTLVMSDIQPPPICRYIKITTIGRYGMSTTKCKIPIGSFFGHMVLLPGEDYAEKNSQVQNMSEENAQNQIQVLSALFEDVQCRYSLACSKLENLVTPLLSSESPNVGHMYNYLHKIKETSNNLETQKITTAYQECITYQHQLNIIRSVMRRFGAKSAPVSTDIQQNLTTACTDKLRVLGESLTDLLLYIVYGVGFDPRVDSAHLHQMVDESQCERLFNCICVGEDIRMQVSCCTLLVRLCGLQPWWGSFLVNTIKQLYSSKQFNIFPQDRVFILLIYMGRKSLCGGANRSSVMDSLLKTILNQLESLATAPAAAGSDGAVAGEDSSAGAAAAGSAAAAASTGFFRLQMDLSLVGWLLLFLSQCLDSQPSFCSLDELPDKMKNSKNCAPASRWDFLQGEMAMQRRTYLTNKCTASRNYRRKLQKKLMHHKQQLDDLETAKKAFHASTQALSALSSQAAKLSCKLESALKQQEQYYKKSSKQATSPRSKDQPGSFRSSRSGECSGDIDGKRASSSLKDSDCQFLMLPRTHCLPVARALIKFLLHMDITCNIDLFLLVCKVIARVTVWTKPAVSLGEIMTQDQLASLLLIAVSNRSVWGGPWASHAITCLLQDIIQGVNSKPSSPVDQSDSRADSKEPDDPLPSLIDVNSIPGPSSSSAKNGESYVLPSLFESDDSEMEDLLEDILERGKSLFIRKSSSRMAVGAVSSISTAVDSRLEYGLENNVSVNLRRITAQAAYNLPLCINSSIAQKALQNDGSTLPVWDESITAPWQLPVNSSVGLSSIEMLSTAFDTLFGQLNQSRDGDLEAVVQLWLTLSTENDSSGGGRNFDASVVPLIQLSPAAISSLMSTLANRGGISVREWCLSFQALTLFSNLQRNCPCQDGGSGSSATTATTAATDHDHLAHTLCGAASLVVMDTNFVPMLDAFLSSPHIKGCAGVSVCNSLHELLVRLEMRCDVVSGNSTWGNRLKELLLNLVYMLVSEGGAIAALYGPLDAQTGLILLLLHLSFPKINLSTAVGILQSVGVLIERYVLNSEGIKGRGVAEPSHVTQPVPAGGSSLTFVLNNPSWEHLLIVMIRLITNLVQTPLESPDHTLLEPTSQTDEHKAANGPSQVVKAKCVADFVVQQELTMAQLIGGLGGCVRSTFSMFQGPFSPDSTDSGDPVSIGDALLQLLSTLAAKATDPKLILKPLFTHLSTCGLTEPLQWLVLQVLDSDHALRELLEMSGIETISTNLVETSGMLISSHPSTVSVIMQYLSQMPNCAPLTSSAHHKKGGCSSSSQTATSNNNYANNSAAANSNNNHNGSSNGHGSAAGSSGGNGSAGVQLESHDAMVNFAPLGIICSSNPSSQSADVLIQPAPPHRRARTPAWSYHFYTEESWVELTITLPCAVLLKAVHIQPHLSSLATCPSGVSVEISRDGRGSFVPVAAPFNTSGLTFVRLTLPHPEVVTSVLLRLYKPRDSSNIGLSQIKLLGATTFGDSDLPEARRPGRYTQSSLGWLRLLHHCLTSASDPTLKEAMLDAAATGAGERLLSACCSLLLASSPPSVTESVLLTLGLHSSQLGLQLINVLLTNGGSLSTAVQSVVGLLFKLGTTDDAYTKDRLATMLEWLHQAATTAQNQLSTAYIQCLASILWTCYEKNINCDMPSMITQPLFSSVYEWTLKLSPHSCLKKAIDSVLCSMCYINPALFPTLLQRMNILVPICTSSPQASISDDRKDTETSSQTDDSKEQESERDTEWYNRLVLQDQNNLSLSEGQLMTVATACQSPPATRHLLDSGLPNLITQALLGFCVKKKHSESKKEQANQSRMTDSDKASERNHVFSVNAMGVMLKFLEEVCMAGQMRDWLGSAEGSIFWGPLLSLLCNKTSTEKRCEVSSTLHSLESATVSFLARCCWCHPNNQKLLAKVLSDVISQHKTTNHKTGGISGVTRRMILQLLLESEKVYVSVQGMQNSGVVTPTHPRHVSRLLHLSVHTTIADILKMISGANGLNENAGADGNETKDVRRDSPKNWHEMTEQQWCEMSVAAGVTAKDKRLKDAKNAVVRGPYGKKPRTNLPDTQTSLNNRLCLRHPDLEERSLPGSLTLSQLLYILDERGISLSNPYVFLTLEQANGNSISNEGEPDLTLSPSLPTALQVFTQQGGLALLAQHLPPVYPETLVHFGLPEKTVTATDSAPADQVVYDAWVKVEHNDDIYEDLDEYVCLGEGGQSSSTVGGGGSSKRQTECGGSGVSAPSVPLHSLAAFGLFLRLPGYAEVLLRDKCKAQCLLRLTLGVTDDGEGGDILTCAVASSLPTLPFEVLRILLESTPLTTDDGVLLRRTTLETGALHLLLSCLAVFTHFPQDLPPLNNQQVLVTSVSKANSCNDKPRKAEEKSHLYWAKGTGFGTGSTAQSWNVEQALSRQRTEEEHVTVLLQVLSSYINPGGRSETYGSMPKSFNLDMETSSEESTDVEDEPERTATPPLPSVFHDILQQSCLLPALSSYLRNDSVLDMARHIPLYRAVLQLLRAMALNPQLVSLLLPQKATIASNELSIVCLLVKMQNCVDIYANRLKNNKTKGHRKSIRSNNNNNNTNNNNNNSKTQEEIDSDEGLALLIPDIQQTACLVQVLTTRIVYDSETDGESTSHAEVEKPLQRTLEERYLEVMKALQFDTYEMIVENSDSNGFQFVVSYHFESNVRSCGERSHPTRMKRLAQETVTLSTSLPLSYSSSVFVRCDSDRLDIMKVLITGPAETPYANGCFELDVFFPPDYPNSPMLINLETTGHHTIRFNPNLYNDGKVCLSVLNTWQGRPEEKWNAHTSSFLQVLVSIQSLILVPEPYFNEPGYERSRGTPSGDQSSREYNSNICQATVKWAMLEQLRNPSPCFKQIIQTHFWMKQKEIRSQIENWIVDMESQASDRRTGRAISLNAIALKRHYHQLLEELRQLRPPPGMEDLAEVEVLSAASDNYTLSSPTNAPAPASITTPTSSSAPSTTAMMVFSSTPPKSTTTPTNSAPETPQANDLETDLQMEKMVSQVCE